MYKDDEFMLLEERKKRYNASLICKLVLFLISSSQCFLYVIFKLRATGVQKLFPSYIIYIKRMLRTLMCSYFVFGVDFPKTRLPRQLELALQISWYAVVS